MWRCQIKYLSVCNWDKFQHYKKRNPPWIKLHCELLANYEFNCLQDASKSHLMLIWLMASQCDNKIPNDPTWLQRKLGTEKKPDINLLIEKGFLEYVAECLQDASNTLSTCISQTEAEAEAEESKPSRHKQIPYQEIRALYHKILPELPECKKLTPKRRAYIRARWKNGLPDLEHWEKFFTAIRGSQFLMGNTAATNGRTKPFIADLEWITNATNYVKIYEGKYHE